MPERWYWRGSHSDVDRERPKEYYEAEYCTHFFDTSEPSPSVYCMFRAGAIRLEMDAGSAILSDFVLSSLVGTEIV
jgi:hypothetical protein